MTSQRVIPVEPLVAYHLAGPPWEGSPERWEVSGPDDRAMWFTDAEFAALFMPAEPLEALLAAVGVFVAADEYAGESHGYDAEGLSEWERAIFALCAAYRAYVEAKP